MNDAEPARALTIETSSLWHWHRGLESLEERRAKRSRLQIFTLLILMFTLIAHLSAHALVPTTNWKADDNFGTVRYGHTATLLADGRVLVARGYGSHGLLTSVEIYDQSADSGTGAWSAGGGLDNVRD